MTTITNLDLAEIGGKRSCASLASYLRPANTTAYTAGDACSDHASTKKAIIFPGCSPGGKIMRARLVVEDTDAALDALLYIFASEPTNFADNEALLLVSADIPKLIGVFEFATASQVVVGTGITSIRSSLNYDALGALPYSTVDGNLYGLLQHITGYTPKSASKVHIRLQLEHD